MLVASFWEQNNKDLRCHAESISMPRLMMFTDYLNSRQKVCVMKGPITTEVASSSERSGPCSELYFPKYDSLNESVEESWWR